MNTIVVQSKQQNVQTIEQLGRWREEMSVMINNTFSVLLAKRLLKISKISEDTGISRTTLTNLYYRRSTKITFEVLDKLCNYLDCSISDIIEYVPDEKEDT